MGKRRMNSAEALNTDQLLLSGAQRMIWSAITNIRQTTTLAPATQKMLVDSLLAAADLEHGTITRMIQNIDAAMQNVD